MTYRGPRDRIFASQRGTPLDLAPTSFLGSEKGSWLEVKVDQNSVRADFAVLTRPERPLIHELSQR